MIVSQCDCPEPRLCLFLGRHIHGRLYDHWTGNTNMPGKSAQYRLAWLKAAGKTEDDIVNLPAKTEEDIVKERVPRQKKPCGCKGA